MTSLSVYLSVQTYQKSTTCHGTACDWFMIAPDIPFHFTGVKNPKFGIDIRL